MPFVIKAKFEEDTRRITLDQSPSFEGLVAAMKSLFATLPSSFTIKYFDEDEDAVTISSDMELNEAIRVSAKNNLLRLQLIVKSVNNSQTEQPKQCNSNPILNFPTLSEIFNNPSVGQNWLESFIGQPAVNQSNQSNQSNPKPNDIPDLVSLFQQMGFGNQMNTSQSDPLQQQQAQQNIQQLLQRLLSSTYIQQLLPQLMLFAPQLIPLLNGTGFPLFPQNSQPSNETKSDTGKDEEAIHTGVVCDICEAAITGVRYKCTSCVNYDLCAKCEAKPGSHDPSHALLKIQKPLGSHPSFMGRGCPYTRPRNVNNNNDNARWNRSPRKTAQQSGLLSRFVQDVTIPDGTAMNSGQQFVKIWKLRNEGEIAWPEGTYLEFVGGDKLAVQREIPVPVAAPGNEVDIAVDMIAPAKPGRYISYWRLCNSDGSRFGQRVWIDIYVQNETEDVQNSKPAPTMQSTQTTQTPQMASMEVETQTNVDTSNKSTATSVSNTTVGTSMEQKQTKEVGVSNTDSIPIVYSPQVQSLLDMGFENPENLQDLVTKYSGDLVAVVQELLRM